MSTTEDLPRFGHIACAALSDVGRRRKNNEDSHGEWPEEGVFCVADGMGGARDGEVASRIVVEHLALALRKWGRISPPLALDDRLAIIEQTLDAASSWIFNYAETHDAKGCGTTFVGVAFDPADSGAAVALHAGDSRLYRVRGRKIAQITRDHSVANMAGVKNEAELDPAFRNMILRAVGINETVEVERTPFDVKDGDWVVICSDGLSKMISDADIARIVRGAHDGDQACRALVDEANKRGGKDNITVVALHVGALPGPGVVHGPLTEEDVSGLLASAPEEADTATESMFTIPTTVTDGGDTAPTRGGETLFGDDDAETVETQPVTPEQAAEEKGAEAPPPEQATGEPEPADTPEAKPTEKAPALKPEPPEAPAQKVEPTKTPKPAAQKAEPPEAPKASTPKVEPPKAPAQKRKAPKTKAPAAPEPSEAPTAPKAAVREFKKRGRWLLASAVALGLVAAVVAVAYVLNGVEARRAERAEKEDAERRTAMKANEENRRRENAEELLAKEQKALAAARDEVEGATTLYAMNALTNKLAKWTRPAMTEIPDIDQAFGQIAKDREALGVKLYGNIKQLKDEIADKARREAEEKARREAEERAQRLAKLKETLLEKRGGEESPARKLYNCWERGKDNNTVLKGDYLTWFDDSAVKYAEFFMEAWRQFPREFEETSERFRWEHFKWALEYILKGENYPTMKERVTAWLREFEEPGQGR